ncbi:MAG: ABC transporter ATP-binding protein [Patescibacteria group bacterium]
MIMIEVNNVTKVYGKKQNTFMALDNVNFQLSEGSTAAIIGKSGSGKSTLMHVMSGLDHPTSGSIVMQGKELHELKSKAMDAFRAREMSFIFQAFFVEPNQTVYQNVLLPLEIANTPRRKRKKMVLEALKAVDLTDKIDSNANNLSGGQKQRLAIARSIVNKPKLIFADEPTGNLDSSTGDMIIDLLFYLNKTLGCTLVVVTHDEELASRCQTQIRLKDGRIESISEKRIRAKVSPKKAKNK